MKFLRVLVRGLIIVVGLAAQVWLSLFVYLKIGEGIQIFKIVYGAVGIGFALGLIKNSKNYSYTLPWIIILVLFPVVGGLLYLTLGNNKNKSKLMKKMRNSENDSKKYLIQNEEIMEKLKENGKIKYLAEFSGFPVTDNNDVEYYPLGEIAFESMKAELEKAEKFIFFEYFIVAEGKMWNSILEILKEKANKGVDVRVLYDDFGCITTLETSFPKVMSSYGIKCYPFNKLNPLYGAILNNRDHRKILVIDGKVAFSGGINIADEYININSKYGHWKDNAFKVSGDAVWNYTVMFLSMWNTYDKVEDFTKFKYDFSKETSKVAAKTKDSKENTNKGYLIPYGETPLDSEITGEDVYLNIINQAHDYVYITTPYLIIDTDVINALILARKRGVDVRIVIPGIPDKRIVYSLSKSYAKILVKSGVKVYKYTPGFVHAKVFVSDNHIATVGTINLDYRSLYLHFECGCYMEDVSAIKDIKKDLDDTISKSEEMTDSKKKNFVKDIWHAALRLVAPLL